MSNENAAACPGRTGKGTPCPRTPGPSGRCMLHDPEAQRARGRRGGAARGAGYRLERELRAGAVRLGSADGVRALLERAAALAEASEAAPLAKAGLLHRIGQTALEALRTSELEREAAELRALLEGHGDEDEHRGKSAGNGDHRG